MSRILIVDDEPQIRRILSIMLREKGFEVAEAESGARALLIGAGFRPDVALLDLSMPEMDGISTLRTLLEIHPKLQCIMMTAYGTIQSAVEAIKLGAFHYLTKPFDNNALLLLINRALELNHLSNEVEELRSELSLRYGFNEIVGISPKLKAVFHMMTKVAPVDATVLICGESGTGKEMIARAIHRRSHRAAGPFVAVNCGAIPAALFEAEFFGHERGAFTDAKEARAGHFEKAQLGTLFLDEVGELQLETQVKLLRALQTHQVTRLGGRKPISVDVRVIAATNLDLKSAVEHGRFREDLYWRLNVVKIVSPSLRDRKEDIPLLVDHMLNRFNKELNLSVKQMAPAVRELLSMYDWPGNVRELENTLCSAMIMCEGHQISVQDLPARITGGAEDGTDNPPMEGAESHPLAQMVKEATEKIERAVITTRLAELRGSRTATAESLGMSRKSLFNKMRQYGLSDEEADVGGSEF